MRLKPDSFEASSARGALLAGFDRLPEALDQINHALRLKPGHPVALYNRACVYSLLGDTETAIQDSERRSAVILPIAQRQKLIRISPSCVRIRRAGSGSERSLGTAEMAQLDRPDRVR